MNGSAHGWLETQQPQMLADLIELANQNSGSNHLNGLLALADWLEAWMGFSQAKFTRIALPPRLAISDSGERMASDSAPALRWDFRPESSLRILLAIHYDTVFGCDHSFQTCQLLGNDKLGGPGVADAKGGIVVLRSALQALANFELLGSLGWTVLLNPDEEVGSPSSKLLFEQIAPEFAFGLLFEPALPSGELVASRKGSGNFDLVVRGRSAHAGRHFEDGRNAIAHLSRLLVKLDDLNGLRAGTTINLGSIRGGGPVNVVPDLAVGRFNVRLEDTASLAWLDEQLGGLVAEANRQEGLSVKLHGGISSPPKPVTAVQRHLMSALDSAATAIGSEQICWVHTGGVCDGNKLAAAGLPNIDTLGPIGGGLHSSEEWVQVSSLSTKAKLMVNLISRFAAGEFPELRREIG